MVRDDVGNGSDDVGREDVGNGRDDVGNGRDDVGNGRDDVGNGGRSLTKYIRLRYFLFSCLIEGCLTESKDSTLAAFNTSGVGFEFCCIFSNNNSLRRV